MLGWQDFDVGRYMLRQVLPALFVLCVVLGSFILWRRTGRVAALLQLLTSALLVLHILLQDLKNLFWPFDPSPIARLLQSSLMHDIADTVAIASLAVFAVASLWYALGEKRI